MTATWKFCAAVALLLVVIAVYTMSRPGTHVEQTYVSPTDDGPAAPSAAYSDTDDVQSLRRVGQSVGDLKISVTNRLPRNPHGSDTGNCGSSSISPKSKGGAIVQRSGWISTGEISVDGYDAVSFAGKLETSTSGACSVTNANVGIFRDRTLQAIIYGTSDKFAGVTSVAVSPAGLIRLFGDIVNYDSPIADVVISKNGISIQQLPDSEAYCNGRVSVPNVRNQSITIARNSLIRAGWQPVPSETDGYVEPLVRAGVVETQSCAGTGFGQCLFLYRNAAGPELRMVSIGDTSQISDYRVSCDTE